MKVKRRMTTLKDLPIRTIDSLTSSETDEDNAQPKMQTDFKLDIVSLKPENKTQNLIVSIIPPELPTNPEKKRAACDIVLVIDVSGSMHSAAPVPTAKDAVREENGLSVLDLVKHAARTILSTLDDGDRLGIVTYSDNAEVVSELIPVTSENKKKLDFEISWLDTANMTNMWDGIKTGLKRFVPANEPPEGLYRNNVRAMLVLTDGLPNLMAPAQGYVAKIQELYPVLPCTIHTFGFGYQLRSGLLKSIAEVGHGTYNYIPDAGFIGTIFVHAVANLQATCVTQAMLKLSSRKKGIKLRNMMGSGVELGLEEFNRAGETSGGLTIALGNLQYAQSRDIVVQITPAGLNDVNAIMDTDDEWEAVSSSTSSPDAMEHGDIDAVLTFYDHDALAQQVVSQSATLTLTSEPSPREAYHMHRSSLITFLKSLFPLNPHTGEYTLPSHNPQNSTDCERLAQKIKGWVTSKDAASVSESTSLLEDMEGEAPHGQIRLAIDEANNWKTWGTHYLLSLLSAHQKQMCNSFMDPGPLMYGRDSELFQRCKKELDRAFDELPAPKPSRRSGFNRSGTTGAGSINMGKYNRSDNPCFAGKCTIRLDHDGFESDAGKYSDLVPFEDLKLGHRAWTPMGPREILAIVKSGCSQNTPLVKLRSKEGTLLITPWHPVFYQESWKFPADLDKGNITSAGEEGVDFVYSILLEAHPNQQAHIVETEGVQAVTLGNGVKDIDDVRCHPFFSDHSMVNRSLSDLKVDWDGRKLCGGLSRDEKTDLACGFVSAPLKIV